MRGWLRFCNKYWILTNDIGNMILNFYLCLAGQDLLWDIEF
jgi:hypothetical protein